MQDENIVAQDQPEINPQESPTPTSQEILAAPEGEWEVLCLLADADVNFFRAWRKRNAQKTNKPSKRPRRRPRSSTSAKGWTAASVLSAKVGDAMVEALERVNTGDDEETRSILVNGGNGDTLIIEVSP